MSERITADPLQELAPEVPPHGPVVWMRENLFSSIGSTILSVVSLVVVLFAVRGLLGFIFDPSRRWDAVTTNLRLLMVQAYPAGGITDPETGEAINQMGRIWTSVGIVVVLIALTIDIFRIGGTMSRRQVGGVGLRIGAALLVIGILGPFSLMGRVGWLVVGSTVGGLCYLFRQGETAKQPTIPTLGVVTVAMIGVLAALVLVPVPVPSMTDDRVLAFEPVARSTWLPWTILFLVAVATHFVVQGLRRTVADSVLRRTVVALWVASFPLIVLAILRDPGIDYTEVAQLYIPAGVAFAVGGGLLLWYLTGPGSGEAGRALAMLFLVASPFFFFFSMPFVIRWLWVSLALFAMAAPTFGGEGAARLRYLYAWVAWVAVLAYLLVLITAESTVEIRTGFFAGGLTLTFILAITGLTLSFPIGVVLALGRTSSLPLFRLMSTAYIELVRGVPLITWLLVAFLMLPVALPQGVAIGNVMRAVGAITFFSAAYLAENVRGGLQSVSKGQFEAAGALGMSTLQTTVFITLPQALRAVIPALVGQVIAVFKDTSLVTIVGLFDFLHIARAIIPTQTQPINFLGSIKETLIFAALVYWIFTFTTSRISLRLEKKLGVGER